MITLSQSEVRNVSGGASLAHPIDNPQSQLGKTIDDVAQLCNTFGNWLGGEIYNATH